MAMVCVLEYMITLPLGAWTNRQDQEALRGRLPLPDEHLSRGL
jgi:hypothetical protein